MAQLKGTTSKGASRSGAGGGTVTVVLPTAAAKDLLNALTQALGGGLGAKPRANAKTGAASSRAKATTSRATSLGARAKPAAARPKASNARAKAPAARAKG